MLNKRSLLLAVLAAILIIAGFLIYRSRGPGDISPGEILKKQEAVAAIIKTGNLDKCSEARGLVISGVNYESVCRNNIASQMAFETLSVSYCRKLDDKLFSVQSCEEQVLANLAQKEGRVAVCNEARSETARVNCLSAFWSAKAVAEKNVSLCDNVPRDFALSCRDDVWIEQLIEDPTAVLCAKFSKNLARDCEVMKRAVSKRDAQSCILISEIHLKGRCELMARRARAVAR